MISEAWGTNEMSPVTSPVYCLNKVSQGREIQAEPGGGVKPGKGRDKVGALGRSRRLELSGKQRELYSQMSGGAMVNVSSLRVIHF